MAEDTETLAELMLRSAHFCSTIETAAVDLPNPERDELRLKIGQCRMGLEHLQEFHNEGALKIENATVRHQFRVIVLGLLWAAFYARHRLDRKAFRILVEIEAGFTLLLANRK
jgi:hypothetical protein